MDLHDRRWYAGRVRLAVLLLWLLLMPAARAENDDEGEEPSGLPARLRAIDEAAEHEAEHPDVAGEEPDPGDDQPPDTAADPEAETAESPARAAGRPDEPSPRAGAPNGAASRSPVETIPHQPPPEADDDP